LADVPELALHLTRKQFYSCLKLIAAHQAGVPLREEILTSTVTLPLPKFSWRESPPAAASSSNSMESNNDRILREWHETRKSPDLIELVRESNSELLLNSDQPSTDSEVESNDTITLREHRRKGGAGSPEAWSTASDSPTPTNSVAERPWAKGALWHGMLCEEQRQLLGTEEESSDKHSSDEDAEVDLESVYQITPEQREYYIKQFRAVQPDLNGLLSGHIAR
jgi:RalBP1-associated Eps domain-containing protein